MDHPAREELDDISKISDTSLIANSLFSIQDKIKAESNTRLFALSGRYFVWQNQSEKNRQDLSFNIWHPADLTLTNLEYIQNLVKDSTHFKLVFQNETMVILEVKRVSLDLK